MRKIYASGCSLCWKRGRTPLSLALAWPVCFLLGWGTKAKGYGWTRRRKECFTRRIGALACCRGWQQWKHSSAGAPGWESSCGELGIAGHEMPREMCLLHMLQVSGISHQLSLVHREVIYSLFSWAGEGRAHAWWE